MAKLSQILQRLGFFSKDIKIRLKSGQIQLNGNIQKTDTEIPLNPERLEDLEFMDLGDLLFELVSNPVWELQLKIFGIENLLNSNIKNSLTQKLEEFIIVRTSKNKALVIIKDI